MSSFLKHLRAQVIFLPAVFLVAQCGFGVSSHTTYFVGARPDQFSVFSDKRNVDILQMKGQDFTADKLHKLTSQIHNVEELTQEQPTLKSGADVISIRPKACGHASDRCDPTPEPGASLPPADKIIGVRYWGYSEGAQYLEVYGTLTNGFFSLQCDDGSSYVPLRPSYVSATQMNIVIPPQATSHTTRFCSLQKLGGWVFVGSNPTSFQVGQASNLWPIKVPAIPKQNPYKE